MEKEEDKEEDVRLHECVRACVCLMLIADGSIYLHASNDSL